MTMIFATIGVSIANSTAEQHRGAVRQPEHDSDQRSDAGGGRDERRRTATASDLIPASSSSVGTEQAPRRAEIAESTTAVVCAVTRPSSEPVRRPGRVARSRATRGAGGAITKNSSTSRARRQTAMPQHEDAGIHRISPSMSRRSGWNSDTGSGMPCSAIRSAKRGRTPVGSMRPSRRPSSSYPAE